MFSHAQWRKVFLSWGIDRAESIASSNKIIVKMMTGSGDLQFNVGSGTMVGPGIRHNITLMPCQRCGKGLA
jgi:hypothetical protein